MIDSAKLADIFVEVADTLVDDFDLADFLHGAAMSAAEVTGSGAVGIMLADHEGLRPMASSNEDARLLELFQVQHAEGPCLDCHRAGEEVADVDIADSADRWPVFAPRAAELGFTTAHCFPLRLREHVIGAMNIFRTDHRFLSDEERRVGRALADLATIGLMQERALRRAEELTEQLQYALNSRIVIEQAKGAVARSLGVGVDEAFMILRRYARNHGLRLTALSRDVLDDRRAMSALVDDSRG
jgi:GAF domain-containing protein